MTTKTKIESYLALGGSAAAGAGLAQLLTGMVGQLDGRSAVKVGIVSTAAGASALGGLFAADEVAGISGTPNTKELVTVVVISLIAAAAASAAASRMGSSSLMQRAGGALMVALVAGAAAVGASFLAQYIPDIMPKKKGNGKGKGHKKNTNPGYP